MKHVLRLLEILLFVSAYAVNYFTHKKMGMARHILYLNAKWEDAYGAVPMKIVFILIPVFAIVFFLTMSVKAKKGEIFTKSFVICISILVFEVLYMGTEMRAFYQVSLIFMVLCLVEEVFSVFILKEKNSI